MVGRQDQIGVIEDALVASDVSGAIIHGAAGVGKSRLAAEVIASAASRGWRTGTATASAAAAAAPLGALAHLLPREVVDVRADPVTLFATVAAAFGDGAGDRRFVLVVDDIPRLDPTSLTLLGQLLDARSIFLVATVRSGEGSGGLVRDLLRRAHLVRVDLDDLTASDVDRLLPLALGSPVEPAAATALWNASRGNPLILRELVSGARANRQLVETHGVWGLLGPLPTTPTLVDVVESRLATIGEGGRRALDYLAVRSPVGLLELEALFGRSSVEEIDRAALVTVEFVQRRVEIGLVHPMYGEVLRDRLTPLARRQLLLDHVRRVAAHGARRREDVLFVATAQLDAGATADPAFLQAAMRLARYGHDHAQVIRLGEVAITSTTSSEMVLLLAEAYHELGQYEDAERVLAGHVVGAATDERVELELASMRVRNLVFGLRRRDAALEVLHEARQRLRSTTMRDELVTDEAIVWMFSGQPLDALAVLDSISADPEPRAKVLHDIVATLALIATGRCETAVTMARTSYAEHVALGDVVAIAHPAVHVIHRVHALTEAGRLEEADRLARRAHEQAIGAAGAPVGQLWFAFWVGRVALLRGMPNTARRWLAEAETLARQTGYEGQRRLVLSFLVTAFSWLDDRSGATAALAELDALEPWAYYLGDQEIGRAWAAVAVDRNPSRAGEILRAAADQAADVGIRVSEARLLFDVARLGDPASVSDRLIALADVCESRLVGAYAKAAAALADGSGDRLREAADDFEGVGATLFAAEVTIAAAAAHRREGPDT